MIRLPENCCGCTACFSICGKHAISMQSNNEGFLVPVIDSYNCIECRMCENVCVQNRKENNANDFEKKVFALKNTDNEIRKKSSSGAFFQLIAKYFIEQGGVVFGCSLDKDLNVHHCWTDSLEDLGMLQESKYVQSEVGNAYLECKEFLLKNRLVLFTGTPCQIAGLKSFLGKDYDNLFCIDIICHGVPSPKLWEKYKKYQESRFASKIIESHFRSKDSGWKNYSMRLIFENGITYEKSFSKDLYLKLFLHDVALRESCYDCQFKYPNQKSDYTIGDLWGAQNIIPEMDDDIGINVVLINSKKANEMYKSFVSGNNCIENDVNLYDVVKYNSALVKSVSRPKLRNIFYKDLESLSFEELEKKYTRGSFKVRMKRKIKKVVKLMLWRNK